MLHFSFFGCVLENVVFSYLLSVSVSINSILFLLCSRWVLENKLGFVVFPLMGGYKYGAHLDLRIGYEYGDLSTI